MTSIGVTQYVQSYSPKKFNLYLHIVADNSGHSRISDQEVDDWLDVLNADFSNGDISFEVVGKEIIKNDYYYYYSHSKFDNLINVNPHDNAIDIYFLGDATKDSKEASKAKDIPSTTFVIGRGWAGTSVISHEMGHCLGLYHTHERRFGEDIDGSDCSNKGDKVCDTPPDPNLGCNQLENKDCDNCESVSSNCYYLFGDSTPYSPDTKNIMSYTCACCMEHFTEGQFSRMHTEIINSSELQSTYFYVSTPQNLTWVNYSGNPKLTWQLVSNPSADSYKIYRNINNCGEDCGSYNLIATVSGTTNNYIDTEVNIQNKNAPLNAYYYVIATKQNHESFPSNIINVPTNTISKKHYKEDDFSRNIILGAYPNPFNSSTKIRFELPTTRDIVISIFNSLGKEIKKIDLGKMSKGIHEYFVEFSNYSSGVYYYRIFANNELIAKGKLINLQ